MNLRGNAGRNILTGPGLSNLDFSIIKNNRIGGFSEAFNLQIRAEIFNLLNHTNFQVPTLPGNTDIFQSNGAPNSSAGLLTSTTTSSRQIQFGVKVIW
jgi:3',5'-cyclic AMP phosphodiesterase CpdA